MTALRRRAVRPADDGERGAITTWVAITSLAMMLFVGIAVDFGGQVVALQRVRDVAAQAARTGGQQVDVTRAMRGQGVAVDAGAARAAAEQYLRQAGVPGNAVITDGGTSLVVTADDEYDTRVLSIIGVSTLPVNGQATVRLVRVVGGTEG